MNGTNDFFGPFQRKFSGSNGTSEKVVLFSRTECSKQKFVFYFFKAIFDNSFGSSRPFFGLVNATEERSVHINGKQPLFCSGGYPSWS